MAAAVLLGIAAAAVLLQPPALFRISLTLPLVLVLPGYAIVEALSTRRRRGSERVVFTLGASLSVAVLAGFLLDALPWGLRAESWLVALGGVTAIGLVLASARRRATTDPPPPLLRRPVARWRAVVVTALAVAAAVLALVVAREGAVDQPQAGFTRLWIQGGPTEGTGVVRLGVESGELGETSYALHLEVAGRIKQIWSPIVLQPGERREVEQQLAPAELRSVIEGKLYLIGVPETVYRRVALNPNPTARRPGTQAALFARPRRAETVGTGRRCFGNPTHWPDERVRKSMYCRCQVLLG